MRFCFPAKFTKPGMRGEPCHRRSIQRFPLPYFLLIPNHPLIPNSLSGHCTKPDPAVGARDGQIMQSLNLYHLFLWLRIVREQMAIFSSVSVIRSHSLRQRWLKQIPGPLQSHHLVFPSAQPPLPPWARLPPACRREVGSRRASGWGQRRAYPFIREQSPWSAKLCSVRSGWEPHPKLCLGGFGAALACSHSACLCQCWGEGNSLGLCPVTNWEAASHEKMPGAVSAARPCLVRRKSVLLGL